MFHQCRCGEKLSEFSSSTECELCSHRRLNREEDDRIARELERRESQRRSDQEFYDIQQQITANMLLFM